jgi:polysaccharide pyruvyl transferase WcaK-like protein
LKGLVFGGWYGSGNLGDEAILFGVNRIFKKVLPDCKLTVLSTDPEYTWRISGLNSVKLRSPRELLRIRKDYFEVFSDADFVIITGGTPIYDYDHLSRIIHWITPVLGGSQIFLFGIGSKHIRSYKGKFINGKMLSLSTRISVRDGPTYSNLKKLTKKVITLTGDSALFYPHKASVKSVDKILVCPRYLNPNSRESYHDHLSPDDIFTIRKKIAKTCDYLIEKEYSITFIPFHTIPEDNDYYEIAKILEIMKNKDVEIQKRPESPRAFLREASNSKFVIGLRLHSLILSSIATVPYLSINYDTKIDGFMSMTRMGDCLEPIFSESYSLTRRVEYLINNRDTLQMNLGYVIKCIKDRIFDEAKIVANLIRLGP